MEWRLFLNQTSTCLSNFLNETVVATLFGHLSENHCAGNNRSNSSISLLSLFSPTSYKKVQSWKDIHVLLPSPNIGLVYRKGKKLWLNIRVGTDPMTNYETWNNIKTNVSFTDRPDRDLQRLLEVCSEHSTNQRLREIMTFVQSLTADRFEELCIHVQKDSLKIPTRRQFRQKVEVLTLLQLNEVVARKVTISVRGLRYPLPEHVSKQFPSITSKIVLPLEKTKQDFFIGGYPEFLLKWYTMHLVPVDLETSSVFTSCQETDTKENSKPSTNNSSTCTVQ